MRAKKPKSLTDTRLIGRWLLGATEYVIEADGWYSVVDGPRGYVISSGDTVLTLPSENPAIPFNRIFGSGPSLIGTWSRTIVDGVETYVEEITFRNDGSFSIYFTLDGSFLSDHSGKYFDNAGILTREERAALLIISIPNAIQFDVPYGPDSFGTYTLSSDLNLLTVTYNNGDVLPYQRIS